MPLKYRKAISLTGFLFPFCPFSLGTELPFLSLIFFIFIVALWGNKDQNHVMCLEGCLARDTATADIIVVTLWFSGSWPRPKHWEEWLVQRKCWRWVCNKPCLNWQRCRWHGAEFAALLMSALRVLYLLCPPYPRSSPSFAPGVLPLLPSSHAWRLLSASLEMMTAGHLRKGLFQV